MEKTSRRSLLRAAAAGGVAVTGLGTAITSQRTAAAGVASGGEQGHGHGLSKPLTGNHAQATVSFGQWDVDPNFVPPPAPGAPPAGPFDRQPTDSNRFRNVHELLPFEVTIDQGGAVTFIISGVHQIVIYDAATTTLADVQKAAQDGSILAGVPPLVEYATGRVYRGLDPRALFYMTPNPAMPGTFTTLQVQDRVEGVNFANAGRDLVVCGVVPHLAEGMHGYVTVREKNPKQ